MNNKISIPKEIFEQIFFKNGGEKKEDIFKSLSGAYILPEEREESNAEIEKGEYVLSNGGVKKALGETHERGGTPAKLNEGDKILSDHLKIGINLAKELNKVLKLDFKSSDTYAKVLDKISKNSGLDKLNDELESYISELNKQNEIDKQSDTKELNVKFLSNKINEINQKKAPLDKEREGAFNMLFEAQEASKPKEGSSNFMQNGGTSLGNKYGISPEREKELMNELPKYQRAGWFAPNSPQSRERFKEFASSAKGAGYEGELDYGAKDLGTEAGKLQEWMVANKPEEVLGYFNESGQPLTAKHVDLIKQNNKDAFTKAGISPLKKSEDYTPEEKAKLRAAMGDKADRNFLLEGFKDYKWHWRAPIMNIQGKVEGTTAPAPFTPQIQAPSSMKEYPQADISNLPPDTPPQLSTPPITEGTPAAEEEKRRRGLLLLPDQSPMLPSSPQPTLKTNRRFERIEPVYISPEQQLSEIDRQNTMAREQIANLPPAQQAAALAALQANTGALSGQVITTTNRANAATQGQADIYNAKIHDAEENAAAQDALDYERRVFATQNAYEQGLRNYYDKQTSNQLNNWKTVEMYNRYNALNPNVQFTGDGYEVINTPNFSDNEISYINDVTKKQQEEAKKAATKKKKFGGRFKK